MTLIRFLSGKYQANKKICDVTVQVFVSQVSDSSRVSHNYHECQVSDMSIDRKISAVAVMTIVSQA